MQFKKMSSLFEYTTWFLKKYNELQRNQVNNIYRIIEIKKLPSRQSKLVVQIIGKSSIIECYPQEVVASDRLLEGFSKKDIRTITYLACEQIKQPKYRIVAQEFCDTFNRIIFKLKENTTNSFVVKTANEIMVDKSILNNLSSDDINSINYMAGYECFQNKNFN